MGDAAGGFWDWTSTPLGPQVGDSGPRVIRGGSWFDVIGYGQTFIPSRVEALKRTSIVSFRPVRSLPD